MKNIQLTKELKHGEYVML